MILGLMLYALFRLPGWVLASGVESGDIAEGSTLHYVYRFCTMAFLHPMGIIFLILAVTII